MLERELTRETGKHSLNAILPKDWAWKRVPDSGKRVNSAGFDGWLKHIPSDKVFVCEIKMGKAQLTEKEKEVAKFLSGRYYVIRYYKDFFVFCWMYRGISASECDGRFNVCLNWLLRQP